MGEWCKQKDIFFFFPKSDDKWNLNSYFRSSMQIFRVLVGTSLKEGYTKLDSNIHFFFIGYNTQKDKYV